MAGRSKLNVRVVAGGVGTGYIHEKLKAGDNISLSGPYGPLLRTQVGAATDDLHGGAASGLSSPRSMILELLEQQCETAGLPLVLRPGARREELYYHAEFSERSRAKHPTFTYVPALSAEHDCESWSGLSWLCPTTPRKAHFK